MKSNPFALSMSLFYVLVFAVVSLTGQGAFAGDCTDDCDHKHEHHYADDARADDHDDDEHHNHDCKRAHKHNRKRDRSHRNRYEGWTIGLGVTGVEFESDGHEVFDQESSGIELSGEYRVSRRIGLEPSIIIAGRDNDHHRRPIRNTEVWGPDHYYEYDEDHFNDEAMGALLFSVNFHLTPDSLIDFHIGPTMGMVVESDWSWFDTGYYDEFGDYHYDWDYDDHNDTDVRAVLGLNMGFDIRFGANRNWVFACKLKGVGALGDDHDDHGYDFVPDSWNFASVGVGYRF